MSISEITTPSFNNNTNEISNREPYDHLNDDCLSTIFMYLPACERPTIALVCKKWRRALDLSWSNVKKLELSHWQYEKYYLKKLLSIDDKYEFMNSLLNRCSKFLTVLDLTAIPHCIVVSVVNRNCQNVIDLKLRLTHFNHEEIFKDAFSNLPKLKRLLIIFEKYEEKYLPYFLLLSLRNVASTLIELVLTQWGNHTNSFGHIPEGAVPIFGELKALQKLEVGGIQPVQQIIQYLENTNHVIQLFADYNMYISNHGIIKLSYIEKLDLTEQVITDNGLYTIANNMKRLGNLSLNGSFLSNNGIISISKLKLVVLNILGENNKIDNSLKLLNKLHRLKLPIGSKITDEIVITVLTNSPHLHELFMEKSSVTVEFFKSAAKLLESRKQHLVVGVNFSCDSKKYESRYLSILN